MIKWEEFEHIHVVRRIREVVGNWFNVDVLFVDEQGRMRNFERGQKKLWSNTLLANCMNNDAGYEFMAQTVEKVNAHLSKSESRQHEFEFLPGLHGVGFPIVVDGEYMGAVVALCFKKDADAKMLPAFMSQVASLGLSAGDAEKAFKAIKYIQPAEMQYFRELTDLVGQEVVTLTKEISSRETRIQELNSQLGDKVRYGLMIGKSKPMQDLYGLLDKIKGSESAVLVQGENGTGKELIAKAIHFGSPRKDKVFVPINCAAFNDNLLESELFGHVKGSFTGAIRDRKGYFEQADGGTLFMDEIGDISPAMQVKLLRVLQDGSFTPVGGTEARKTKARIIAATNRDLKAMVEEGTFRQDLYFRLNVINIAVPPLRDRKEDLIMLCESFLAKSAKEKNIEPRMLTKRTIEIMYEYSWPGNIRELENEMERVTVLAGTESKVTPELLSPRIRDAADKPKVQGSRLSGKLKDALEELERDMIREGLRRTGWNKSRLAKELGISRAGLIMKVEKYNLDKRRLARAEGGMTGTDNE
ncbi:MAG: sigma-54-dependent Fis family transcriptional regulator [Bdellovibrionales bacterium]|nr:sigma-54-dependent Fis family transcriptional regulator [Bdellovibrionales bacterium]